MSLPIPPPPAAACRCPFPGKRSEHEKLLFHGSHHACVAGILVNGFDAGHDGGLIWFSDKARRGGPASCAARAR